ncbi:MAG: hypothetical protein ACKVOB_09705 [Sphingomonas sp.]
MGQEQSNADEVLVPDDAEAHARAARQAIVIIHGMGEQRPMDTVRDFVRTVWEHAEGLTKAGSRPRTAPAPTPKVRQKCDSQLPPNQVWIRPDGRTGSLELRRISTRISIASEAFPKGVRNDFFELYWADLTGGSSWTQVLGWLRYLLFRPLSKVPRDVHLTWTVLWIVTVIGVIGAVATALPAEVWNRAMAFLLPAALVPYAPRWGLLAIAAVLGAFVPRTATASFGRVIRYTRSDPDNIAARAAVRDRGLALLKALHADDEYDRIILASHSLGTILAYDLVSYLWADRFAARTIRDGSPELAAANAVYLAGQSIKTADDLSRFRTAQADLRRLLAARPRGGKDEPGEHWLISDLVTIGSPLTHAEFLLAADPLDLQWRINEREYPACPAVDEPLEGLSLWRGKKAGIVAEDAKDGRHIVFPAPGLEKSWQLHHAAPFAAVRWTNIYDPSWLVARGDQISGPLRENFGDGIKDVSLQAVLGKRSNRFTHTRYWALDADAKQLKAVQEALNFLDKDVDELDALTERKG